MKKKKEESPIGKLAWLILNEATKMNAKSILMDKNGDAEIILLKYKIDNSWIEQGSPPRFLWTNLRNIYLLWAGSDQWKSGSYSGRIKKEELIQEWLLEVSESHDTLEFKSITNEK
jgi:hypothetical protein